MEQVTVDYLIQILVGQVFPIGVIVALGRFANNKLWPIVEDWLKWQRETAGKRLTMAEAQLMVAGRFVTWLETCGPSININLSGQKAEDVNGSKE